MKKPSDVSPGKPGSPATVFKPGQSGNPAGRPKGSRNKLGESFLTALSDDFDKHGVDAIKACRESDPVAYVRVVAGILPKEMKIESRRLDDMTNEELMTILKGEDEPEVTDSVH